MTNLEDRVESLETTISELRKLIAPVGSFPAEWHLSAAESRLLAAMTRTGEVSNDAAKQACGLEGAQTSGEVVRQHMSRIRRKLARRSIQIETVYGVGYCLNEFSLRQVRAAFRPAHGVEK